MKEKQANQVFAEGVGTVKRNPFTSVLWLKHMD